MIQVDRAPPVHTMNWWRLLEPLAQWPQQVKVCGSEGAIKATGGGVAQGSLGRNCGREAMEVPFQTTGRLELSADNSADIFLEVARRVWGSVNGVFIERLGMTKLMGARSLPSRHRGPKREWGWDQRYLRRSTPAEHVGLSYGPPPTAGAIIARLSAGKGHIKVLCCALLCARCLWPAAMQPAWTSFCGP